MPIFPTKAYLSKKRLVHIIQVCVKEYTSSHCVLIFHAPKSMDLKLNIKYLSTLFLVN